MRKVVLGIIITASMLLGFISGIIFSGFMVQQTLYGALTYLPQNAVTLNFNETAFAQKICEISKVNNQSIECETKE